LEETNDDGKLGKDALARWARRGTQHVGKRDACGVGWGMHAEEHKLGWTVSMCVRKTDKEKAHVVLVSSLPLTLR
jgi:hypothetical protein